MTLRVACDSFPARFLLSCRRASRGALSPEVAVLEPELPARPDAPETRSLLEHIQSWRGDRRVAVVVVVAALLAAGVVWMRSTPRSPAPSVTTDGGSSARAAAGAARAVTPTTAAGPIVHVVGAVRASGVVQLTNGARVRDAIVAAGGATADADLQRMNLAAKVTDGQRIVVPRIGQPDPPPIAGSDPTGAGDGAATSGGTTADGSPTEPININTATEQQLEALPGIGPSLAAAIVQEREKLGGFKTIDDLKQVRGIGDGRFADIRDHVTV
jgi:competence protein ComEA